MKLFSIGLILIVSFGAHASEVKTFKDLKNLEGKTISVSIDLEKRQYAGENYKALCYSSAVVKKGTKAIVEKVELKSGKSGFVTFLEGSREPYADATLVLKTVNDNNEDQTFKLSCGSHLPKPYTVENAKSFNLDLMKRLLEI